MPDVNVKAIITAQDKASDVFKGLGENVNKQVTKIGVGMAAAGAGLTLFAKSSTDFTKELVTNTKTLQRETGATAEQASGLLYVTSRLGISAEQTSQTFGIFSKQIKAAGENTGMSALEFQKLQNQIEKTKLEIKLTEAEIKKNGDASGELTLKVKTLKTDLVGLEQQTKTTKDTFKQMGVEVKNADGSTKSFNNILLETADRFKAMPSGAEKTALALELFGRSGKDMIKVLNLGSQGIKDLEENAQKLGLTLTQKNIGQVTQYIQAQKNLTDTTNALKVQVGLLTTPILAAFTQKLSDVALKVTQADGPMAGLLAHFIAFGGPVLTAGGGLLTFGANLSQVLTGVRGLGIGLSGLAAFMTGPLGLVIGGVTVLAGILTAGFLGQTTQTQSLKAATDALKTSQDSFKDSQLALSGANLAVEASQRAYNTAVAQFGPDSLEARQALQNLQVAQDQAKDAANRHNQALEDLKNKEREVSKEKALIGHLSEISGALGGVQRSADGAVTSINALSGKASSKNAAGQPIDLSPLLKGRAGGGPVTANTPYLVGEEGPEIFQPGKSGSIIPNHKISHGESGALGQPAVFNVTIQAGAFMSSQQDARKYAKLIIEAYKDLMSSRGVTDVLFTG